LLYIEIFIETETAAAENRGFGIRRFFRKTVTTLILITK